MTSKVEIEELINVLEEIRSTKYPDIPAELIKNIVYAEFEKHHFIKEPDKEQIREI